MGKVLGFRVGVGFEVAFVLRQFDCFLACALSFVVRLRVAILLATDSEHAARAGLLHVCSRSAEAQ